MIALGDDLHNRSINRSLGGKGQLQASIDRSSDRVADQDGKVGATIRFVTDEDRRERRSESDEKKAAKKSGSVLDELGY